MKKKLLAVAVAAVAIAGVAVAQSKAFAVQNTQAVNAAAIQKIFVAYNTQGMNAAVQQGNAVAQQAAPGVPAVDTTDANNVFAACKADANHGCLVAVQGVQKKLGVAGNLTDHDIQTLHTAIAKQDADGVSKAIVAIVSR